MARPRKDPTDPKWAEFKPGPVVAVPHATPNPWQMYFAAALTGLIARGGASMESMIKTAKMYADEAVNATGEL
jgi:hypothetical protein